ncbi:DUF4199 domain-containing protein [Parasphingopyxis algicola]|uniref:DUF4199 domain-containing protein n=1 Tax=Parasphingopyxis algicola TaxID=2026624 RepID=UPI0015A437F4|nr:DUF4199 domain-containing protein [Parasphingopyxis algicola]QLC25893.1 DUF4199 domain-containing protein [Parasphingopyxis algicola]
MTRIAVIYGALSGIVVCGIITIGMATRDEIDFSGSVWFGYLIMLIGLSLVFMGIKRYRDVERGGVIGFGRALLLGLAISAVAGIAYVVTWEIYLASSNYAFIDDYIASMILAKQEAGMAGAELEREIAALEEMRESYANPFFRLPMTFLEIFPVGLIVSLISAAILRKSEVLPAQG